MKIKLLSSLMLFIMSITTLAQNFNYLGTYSSNGTPDYLESPGDNIPVSTLELINSALPETFQVPSYNPHYITSGYDSDIFVNVTTDVYMTFVDEGAGFRNVLGFYTYDLNNPPVSAPADEDITVIFPNNSKLGSGGGLVAGDKVKLGTFTAGTGIGFVLLSNGWNGSQVTNGYWRLHSNPNFNPESDISKRHHNVLIKDDANELVIMGFEDIHREHSWCDHDFNDALYYITATEYTDITTTNIVSSNTSTDVYSANLGGFESKGDLTGKMALKNINRLKFNNEASSKSMQKSFKSRSRTNEELAHYFPEHGMFEIEEAFISTSLDPVNYSNASDVFSIDYYLQEERVSAALLTVTEERIYDHSKHICDRLNGSVLQDVRPLMINNHRMIFSIIERDNGYIEYTISFSIKKGEAENELVSRWNIGDYPEGDYLNFQIWGKSMGQVAHLVSYVIGQLQAEKELTSDPDIERYIPTVFVSSAVYRDQKLTIDFINKSGNTEITLNANVRKTEQMDFNNIQMPISLTGEFYDSVEIETGFMFDGGFALINTSNNTSDNVYLADGTWGIDYSSDNSTLNVYTVNEQVEDLSSEMYQLERSASVSGTTEGAFNLFRYPLPGDLSLDTQEFDGIQFYIKNNTPVTVSIVPPDMAWDDRWTFELTENDEESLVSINFDEFVSTSGANDGTIEKVKTIMFSVVGEEGNPVDFSLDVKEIAFKPSATLSTDDITLNTNEVFNYPNPFNTSTTFMLPKESSKVKFEVYDVLGRTIFNEYVQTSANRKSFEYQSPTIVSGIYLYVIRDENDNIFKGKFVLKN
ncbi:DUF4114 domain-containing protein [Tenacibaculum xiamenense]|uniref:DUF4114 domain-containing protein n=1 Tax=Tenacibaculum xiamenense TaxID=1261553 RepID=UPI0038B5171C